MWTNTYDDDHLPADAQGAREDVQLLGYHIFKYLYPKYGKFPWVAVVERGEESDRLHVHVATNIFIPYAEWNKCWSKAGRQLGNTQSPRLPRNHETRTADVAAYLSAYVKKGCLELRKELGKGKQCYSRARGFPTVKESKVAADFEAAKFIAAVMCDADGNMSWMSSDDWKDHAGPPVAWATTRKKGNKRRMARALHRHAHTK